MTAVLSQCHNSSAIKEGGIHSIYPFLGVTLIDALIGFIQDGRAESTLAALASSVTSEVTVLRGSEKLRLRSTALVPGDVVVLAAGDKVPADLRLFRAKELQGIEAALTGESTAVAKHGATLPILWINMTTAVFLGLMLAFEPIERGIMKRAPRPPGTAILSGLLIWRIVLVNVLLLAGAFCLFLLELGQGHALAEARTVAVNVFVVVEAFYLFNCRSLQRSALSVGLFANPAIWYGVATMAVLQLVLTYVPLMNRLFATAPIGIVEWLEVFAVGMVASLVVGVEKLWTHRNQAWPAAPPGVPFRRPGPSVSIAGSRH